MSFITDYLFGPTVVVDPTINVLGYEIERKTFEDLAPYVDICAPVAMAMLANYKRFNQPIDRNQVLITACKVSADTITLQIILRTAFDHLKNNTPYTIQDFVVNGAFLAASIGGEIFLRKIEANSTKSAEESRTQSPESSETDEKLD